MYNIDIALNIDLIELASLIHLLRRINVLDMLSYRASLRTFSILDVFYMTFKLEHCYAVYIVAFLVH